MTDDRVERPPTPVRGRGAVRNVTGRFERFDRVPVDDGWPGDDDLPAPRPTTVTPERARSIVTTNDSPDIPFDQSINPYRGCEHGCVYCYARATHAYLGLSPGLDFETQIFSKPEAGDLLRRTLARPGYRCSPLALGANTDPYQPVERRLGLTRGILEVLAQHRHPVTVVTKSAAVLRDRELLAALARDGLAAVYLSVTTLDPGLARTMEPRASTPARRLAALGELSAAGIPTGVLSSPMIPGLNDTELERILEAAAAAGARTAGYILLRLPHEVGQVFEEWLRAHVPTKAEKVLGQLRAMHGGRLYDARFGERQTGRGTLAALLRQRFEVACRRLGLDLERPRLDCSRFRVPGAQGLLFS